MPRTVPNRKTHGRSAGSRESRHTVALAASVSLKVARYAKATDTSMSKALAALVRAGLEAQEQRKREFFTKLRANLGNTSPQDQDRLVDEFRDLILGR